MDGPGTAAWDIVVVNLRAIEWECKRATRSRSWGWGWQDLWPYAVERVWRDARRQIAAGSSEPRVGFSARYGALDGLRELSRLDGYARGSGRSPHAPILTPFDEPNADVAGARITDFPDPNDACSEVEAMILIHQMPPRLGAVAALRYAEWTLVEIGALLGVTESRACQLSKEAAACLS